MWISKIQTNLEEHNRSPQYSIVIQCFTVSFLAGKLSIRNTWPTELSSYCQMSLPCLQHQVHRSLVQDGHTPSSHHQVWQQQFNIHVNACYQMVYSFLLAFLQNITDFVITSGNGKLRAKLIGGSIILPGSQLKSSA